MNVAIKNTNIVRLSKGQDDKNTLLENMLNICVFEGEITEEMLVHSLEYDLRYAIRGAWLTHESKIGKVVLQRVVRPAYINARSIFQSDFHGTPSIEQLVDGGYIQSVFGDYDSLCDSIRQLVEPFKEKQLQEILTLFRLYLKGYSNSKDRHLLIVEEGRSFVRLCKINQLEKGRA